MTTTTINCAKCNQPVELTVDDDADKFAVEHLARLVVCHHCRPIKAPNVEHKPKPIAGRMPQRSTWATKSNPNE